MKTNGTCNDVHGESDNEAQGTLMGTVKEVEERTEKEEHCGLGFYQPKWARVFESTNFFMVVFLSGWVLQGVFYTYFVSVITTIEKLFRIKSKTTGALLAATEVGQICTALFLTYFAGRGHRPRWIACGMTLFALGSFGCALPHFIYGDKLLETLVIGKDTTTGVCGDFPPSQKCAAHVLDEQQAASEMTNKVLPMFFLCLFAVGVGQTAITTLGIPYIDDNVASKESPLYIAITIGVRIVGPAGGFILGSFCTRLYVNLSSPVGLEPADAQWIGAWWLGLVLVSTFLFLMGLCMFCFPRQLRSKVSAKAQNHVAKTLTPRKRPQLKDFPKTLKRQLSNDILMLRTVSCVLHLLPVAGFFTFLPKYLESQFRLPTHDANLISGIGGILVMGVGILLSGAVILKLVPTARFVAGWIAITALVYSAGMLILMFVGCPTNDLVGLNQTSISSHLHPPLQSNPSLNNHFSPVTSLAFTQNPSCQSSCTCDKNKFDVICGQDGKTYFSPCHAGCLNVTTTKDERKYFYDCKCIQFSNMENITSHTAEEHWSSWGDMNISTAGLSKGGAARSGYCAGSCQSFVLFICIFSFIMFTHATGEVGSILLIMRCTDPKDKAMAMGIIQFAIGLFGNVPCPIIFGAVVDSACLLWDSVCGTKGACTLYDSDIFRHFFLGTTGGIMGLAFFIDLIIWHKSSKIDITPEGLDSVNEECPKALPQDLSSTPLTTQNSPPSDTRV